MLGAKISMSSGRSEKRSAFRRWRRGDVKRVRKWRPKRRKALRFSDPQAYGAGIVPRNADPAAAVDVGWISAAHPRSGRMVDALRRLSDRRKCRATLRSYENQATRFSASSHRTRSMASRAGIKLSGRPVLPHSTTATTLGHRTRRAVVLPGCYRHSLRRLSETRLPSRAHESRKTR